MGGDLVWAVLAIDISATEKCGIFEVKRRCALENYKTPYRIGTPVWARYSRWIWIPGEFPKCVHGWGRSSPAFTLPDSGNSSKKLEICRRIRTCGNVDCF